MTPFLTAHVALATLVLFAVVYAFIFSFGIYFIYRLLRAGPQGALAVAAPGAMPNRPMSVADPDAASVHRYAQAGE
jgi:cytochrome d ubiquinol oxidase subunit I